LDKQNRPIRVLHVLGTLNRGGAESRIMDLYRHLDREKVQFDFLVHCGVTSKEAAGDWSTEHLLQLRPKGDFDDEVKGLGGQIYVLPRFTGTNLSLYKKAAQQFFAQHHDFAAVEGHMTSMASIYLPIAKKCGVPVTIAHARSAGVDAGLRGIATKILRRNLANKCDYMFACSKAAGIAVFGQKAYDAGRVIFVPNGLDIRDFAYRSDVREKIRAELGIPENAVVLGHVGRFEPVKNQLFIAQLLEQLCSLHPETDWRLLFVGKGAQMEEVRDRLAKAGLGDRAVFAGACSRERTAQMYQAFDAFVFPSLYEGLPGTVIEAQSAGLPCLLSDAITKEVCVTDLVRQYSLDDPAIWVRALTELHLPQKGRETASKQAAVQLSAAGYDAAEEAKRLSSWYIAGGRDTL
jgi:glycosyltransferase involved in cell wall biosynthesis